MLRILEKPASKLRTAPKRVVFAGNPNCGKTTLFNRLTGLRSKTSNYPGTTVELRRARQADHSGVELEYIDLPGLYGLEGTAPEERIAAEFLRGGAAGGGKRTLVVLVVDATRLGRNLYLASQLRERADEVVVALNMTDIADREGVVLDAAALAREVGVPVLPMSARNGCGIGALRAHIANWAGAGTVPVWAGTPCSFIGRDCSGCPHRARFEWAEEVEQKVTRRTQAGRPWGWRAHFDRWATHPWFGLLLFAVIMAGLFQALFHLAEFPMNWIDHGFGWLRQTAMDGLPAGIFRGFVVDGLLTGIAGMVIFLPQIAILFFLLSLLEDTGYLARAALVSDRWMARVGLPGKAFLPILSAHACAIPAVMSTRTIEDPKDRLVAILVLPLFTCSARIPVYIMVTAMLFPHSPGTAGLVFTGAYFLGMCAAFATALIVRGSLIKGRASPLLIELPEYKAPSLRTALLTMVDRGGLFLRRAGTVIVAIIALLWVLAQFPVLPADTPADSLASVTGTPAEAVAADDADQARRQLEHSIIGRLGRTLEPVFAPLGFDWRVTVGILTSFAAREALVSTLSVLYGLGEHAADAPQSIAELLREHLTTAAGYSLLVFFVLAMQCLPTQVVVRRETGSWKWPLAQLSYMSALAYGASFLTYQLVSRL